MSSERQALEGGGGERSPGLVAVGPQRTASSWLDQALRRHPRLALPAHVKETFFFDCYFDRGWSWYRSLFGAVADAARLAEVGSTYFESRDARERIRATNPDTRIVITVRNPIARTFSSFMHEYAKGRASADFFAAVTAQPRIVESGRYGVIAPKWEAEFGHDKVFYLVQEDIEADPQGALNTLCSFLGVEAIELPEELLGRYGQGTVPRFPPLASAVSSMAGALRGAGMHRVVELGKRLGLKRVYRGGDGKELAMTRSVFDYLNDTHDADIRFLEMRLGRAFPSWRDPALFGLDRK